MAVATPTINEGLPFRAEGFGSLVEGLDYAARGRTGMNFFSPRGELRTALPYAELRRLSLDLALRLAAKRLRRGDRVAMIADTGPDFVVAFFGCQYAGLVPVPLPLAVNFGGHDAYVARLRGMIKAAGARALVAPAELGGPAREASLGTAVSFVESVDALLAGEPAPRAPEPLGPQDPCYIQYSSGSTSFPRGVLVTQAAITANARDISRHGIELRPGDRCTSWLPLYHDMGLVGCCLTPVLNQISVDYLATSSFARRPLVWLKLLSEQGGTISFSPTFGYELCAKRAGSGGSGKGLEGLDLSRWRVAGIGGEMIRPEPLDAFANTFAAVGFKKEAFVASYGMAEATLAVTFAPLGRGVKVDRVATGEGLERRKQALPAAEGMPSRGFAVCGAPMQGYRVEIRDELGRPLPDRRVGRVCLQGPSMMGCYFRNEDATRAALTPDGWLDSGDLGYTVDGGLVVTGRSKDLIIVGGRNIWPQDLEWSVERLDKVRAGDVAAFAVNEPGQPERVVLVVECRTRDPLEQELLRREVEATVARTAGVEATVILAPPRSLAFTTSGKLSRAGVKAAYLDGVIADLADEDQGRGEAVATTPAQAPAALAVGQ